MSDKAIGHTPGPWVVEEERRYPIDITTECGRVICEVDCDSVWNEFNETVRDPTEEQMANAYLIAAAPKLLEALYEALPFVNDDDGAYKAGYVKKVERRILAAINKAEGKS